MKSSRVACVMVVSAALNASCGSGGNAALGKTSGDGRGGLAGNVTGAGGATGGVRNQAGAGGNAVFDAGGAGGTAGAGGSGGTSGEAGVGGAIPTRDAGAVDGVVVGSVRCGNAVCETPAETCGIDYAALGSSCVTRGPPLCPGGCLIDECDGSEDCPTGQTCHFTLGENFYFWCQDGPAGYGTLCTTNADCPTSFAMCRDLTDVGRYVAALGYQPRICDQ